MVAGTREVMTVLGQYYDTRSLIAALFLTILPAVILLDGDAQETCKNGGYPDWYTHFTEFALTEITGLGYEELSADMSLTPEVAEVCFIQVALGNVAFIAFTMLILLCTLTKLTINLYPLDAVASYIDRFFSAFVYLPLFVFFVGMFLCGAGLTYVGGIQQYAWWDAFWER